MRKGLPGLPVAALATALLAGPIAGIAWAQNDGSPRPGSAAKPATTTQLTDAGFAMQAAQSNMAELKLSQLAVERSQNEQVREFAELMLTDHGKAGSQLKQIAADKGLKLPTSLLPKHQAALTELDRQQGAAFDAAYIKQMKQDHDTAVALFEQAGETEGLDPALRAFARKTLPTLQAHQQRARELNSAAAGPRPVSATARASLRRVHHIW